MIAANPMSKSAPGSAIIANASTAAGTARRNRTLMDEVRRAARTPKATLAFIFLPLLIVAGTGLGWPAVLPHVAAAVAGACLVDLLIVAIGRGVWAWPTSAALSGLIVAFVLGLQEPVITTFFVGAIASLSKQLLRTRRGHLFNPAALALVVSVPLFGTGQSWWGALPDLPWPLFVLLVAGGAVLVDRLNKFPAVLSFLATYFGMLSYTALLDPTRVAELFRAPFLQAAIFLACFMLTDPPTSPGRQLDQVWVGALMAVVAVVAQVLGAGQSYLLVGLLAGDLALAVWRWTSRGLKPTA